MKSQRRWHALFPRTGLHFRLFIPVLAAVALFDMVILNLVLWFLRELGEALPGLTDAQILALVGLRHRIMYVACLAIMVPGLLAVLMMGFVSHRVVGPLVPIRRHIRKLISGHFDDELRLRRDDDLGLIAEDLNELTAQLRSRR